METRVAWRRASHLEALVIDHRPRALGAVFALDGVRVHKREALRGCLASYVLLRQRNTYMSYFHPTPIGCKELRFLRICLH